MQKTLKQRNGESNMKQLIVLSAGGTGGHCFPALACALALREAGYKIYWIGNGTFAQKLTKDYQIDFCDVKMKGLTDRSIITYFVVVILLFMRIIRCLGILLKIRASSIVTFGGYTTAPVGIAAWLLRIPLFIHEQNSVAGKVNRLLAPFATAIAISYQPTFHLTKKSILKKLYLTGNPIVNETIEYARKNSKLPSEQLRVLILGGSQGAHAINKIFLEAVPKIKTSTLITCVHQCGEAHELSIRSMYNSIGVTSDNSQFKVYGFLRPIAHWYQWCDLVIARAGAMTLAELALFGIPSILIPLPTSADNHQWHNGCYYSSRGAALIKAEHECSSDWLSDQLLQFATEKRVLLNKMSESCKTLSIPEATSHLLQLIISSHGKK
ncbi:MAG: undecaprenyldiphospho-muramoylpentapeptide beta-N-acetylglucosaminyltransferase [Methylacidiphilales bacterium]|nr:undecaprenyldiphospho-muramoylpentapeptide beta-N-acetylglucosaminyltransferase [Candidatus Methylacidiphilales bacterium]